MFFAGTLCFGIICATIRAWQLFRQAGGGIRKHLFRNHNLQCLRWQGQDVRFRQLFRAGLHPPLRRGGRNMQLHYWIQEMKCLRQFLEEKEKIIGSILSKLLPLNVWICSVGIDRLSLIPIVTGAPPMASLNQVLLCCSLKYIDFRYEKVSIY